MTYLFHNYSDPNAFKPTTDRFISVSKSATTLFWAMLSQMNPDVADLNMNQNVTGGHVYTKWTGKLTTS